MFAVLANVSARAREAINRSVDREISLEDDRSRRRVLHHEAGGDADQVIAAAAEETLVVLRQIQEAPLGLIERGQSLNQ